MTRSRGIRAKRRNWTAEEDALLKASYATVAAPIIAEWTVRSLRSVYMRANYFGLKRDPDALHAQNVALGKNLTTAGTPYRYPKGHVPANKGVRRPGWAPGRMRETQFKKGRPAHEARNYKPIGSLRTTKDGLLERKVSDDPNLVPARRWVGVHRLVWEAANGPIPPKHIVTFKAGMTTSVENEITLDRLEMITMAENMKRNTVHNLPKPLKQVIQLRGVLRRHINKRDKANEQQHK